MSLTPDRVKTLHRQRGHVTGQITSLVKVLDDKETSNSFLVQASLESMEKSFEKFEAIQEELEENDESELEHREKIITSYNVAIARARQYLHECEVAIDAQSIKSGSHNSGSNGSSASHSDMSIKLPRIPLPEFDSQIENWSSFYDLFMSVVEKTSLSGAGKLAYLKKACKGRANSLIDPYTLTDSNYQVAMDLLKSKYDFPRRAIRRHWVILRELPRLPKDTSEALGHLVESFQKHLKALENLGAPVKHWDIPIIDMILSKIGSYTSFQWELTLENQDFPSYTHLLNYLEKRANSSDFTSSSSSAHTNQKSENQNFKKNSNWQPRTALVAANNNTPQCSCCDSSESHRLFQCPKFKGMSIEDRIKFVMKLKRCFNCLAATCDRAKNSRTPCNLSKRVCKTCSYSHHTLLCRAGVSARAKSSDDNQGKTSGQTTPASDPSAPSAPAPPVGLVAVSAVADVSKNSPSVLLGSAVIEVMGGDGHFHSVRALIDSAASESFCLLSTAQRIGLSYDPNVAPELISGIGGTQVNPGVRGHTTCWIRTRFGSDPVLPTETIISQHIVTDLPSTHVSNKVKSYYSDLTLADEKFNIVHKIEFLLGADIFPFIFNGKKRFGPPGFGVALDSIFGWVIMGRINVNPSQIHGNVALLAVPTTDELLRRFWELEEIPDQPRSHPDDVIAEKLYTDLHYRQSDGRYVVPLLLKEDAPPLGNSKNLAFQRLTGVLRRLDKDPEMKAKYIDFMNEYESLGHMTPVPPEKFGQAKYYIPHHCVTGKFRVVFDASMKTSSNVSLNQSVYSGKKLQKDIFDIMSRFRLHQKVFTCDISKMYRMIMIREEDRTYQHILWQTNGKIQEYELNTVTYGVTSSPFCALRTVQQLDHDEGLKYPLASQVIKEDIFVDDIATGQDTIPLLLELKRQVISMFKEAGCDVAKWASNCPELLAEIAPENCVTSFDLNGEKALAKILGIHWNAQLDCFYYQTQNEPHQISKRTILSFISRLYDPLGLLSPIILKAKNLIQRLWLKGISWDETVPTDLADEWTQIYEKLPSICSIKIDRCVVLPDAQYHTLIGYADGSQVGYCATAYLRSESVNGVKVSLLAAKSKVAPTKTVSIPRLELCAAKLLATLLSHLIAQFEGKLEIQHVAAFTDSQVVLTWIQTEPCKLKTFEANRVTFIQEKIEPSKWKFCPGDQNPSDIGSRGCFPDQLEKHALWWTGPAWLADPPDLWPTFQAKSKPIPIALTLIMEDNFRDELLSRFSNFTKLQRVTAWILRFIRNATICPEKRVKGPVLSIQELDDSRTFLIKNVQKKHFAPEIKIIKRGEETPKTLAHLQPFLDSNDIIRVGGRLENSNLTYHAKHPILLPKHDPFVTLLIDAYHIRYLHAGPRLLQSLLMREFWIISARQIIRSRISKCHPCFKVKPTNHIPLMGDLPESRIVPVSRAFQEVQIDFGGPFTIREHRRRNPRLSKAYLSLFVCAASKACHLEVVSDLTADGFVAALDRFVSRRGLCHRILTDNATNFSGAKNYLTEVIQFLKANKVQIEELLTTRNIKWDFIPPTGPNFGGLHEAGIKSAKYHLKRVVGDQTLTFEELSTVFAKIEAIMNSRPLCALSTDTTEVDVLTPGHLIIGGPIVALPEYEFIDTRVNQLSRWQLLQKMTQQFWRIWSRDYLHTLIQKSKWQKNPENLKIGNIVIISDDDAPPTRWKKGIVDKVHPGKDGIVRVVTVRTHNSVLKRPASKIYPLP